METNTPPRNKPLASRSTPYLDAWTTRLIQLTSPRGKKAELARFVAKKSNRSLQHVQPTISRLTKKQHAPSAELLLSVTDWMDNHSQR